MPFRCYLWAARVLALGGAVAEGLVQHGLGEKRADSA